MLGKLHDALKAANIPDDKSREAAGRNPLDRIAWDLTVLKWMVAITIGLTTGVLWIQWQALGITDRIEHRLSSIQNHAPLPPVLVVAGLDAAIRRTWMPGSSSGSRPGTVPQTVIRKPGLSGSASP
jgi:hypothetical protein